MMGLLPLSFASPLLLGALLALPVIWWLLRFTPPSPRRLAFPPTRLLLDLARTEETPDKSPWWLTALRMLLAACVILALAGPVWNPSPSTLSGSGPLLVVLDTGWTSAKDFDRRREAAARVIDEAEAADRPVVLAATAVREAEQDLTPKSAREARQRLGALAPLPFVGSREALVEPLAAVIRERGIGNAVWVSDGTETGAGAAFGRALAERLPPGALTVYADSARLPLGLKAPVNGGDALTATVVSTGRGGADGVVQARDVRGRIVGEERFALGPGEREARVTFGLPVELRNEITTLEIIGEDTAGAVQLLDERARRRTVGLVSGERIEAAQPLLSPLHYISRALAPFADIREPERGNTAAAIRDLVRARSSIIVLADVGTVTGETAGLLTRWVEAGGTLVRFSGPRLAAGADELVPVRLRRGGRVLGGSLSWETPQPLAPFGEGPFAGLATPADVAVERQVLAEPDIALPERTWATLADGTPLVTAATRGRGRIVLFHVTADQSWSNLPLSGAFVEMLRRIAALSAGTVTLQETEGEGAPASSRLAAQTPALLPPLRSLDGRGTLIAAPGTAKALPAEAIDATSPSRDHPPGLYGAEDAYRALNLLKPADTIEALDLAALAALGQVRGFEVEGAVELKPWLLAGAAVLLLVDALAVIALAAGLGLAGLGARGARRAAGAAAIAVLLATAPDASAQQSAEDFARSASLETRLAYVVTGNREIDETSLAGLRGLTRNLTDRTALEPGEPMGVDPARDELAFFPFLYWPVDPDAPTPAPGTLARVDAFMKQGGTILFDTRDELLAPSGPDGASSNGPGAQALQRMLAGLDLPPLEPVPSDHVVTKAFYLLQDFPGRYQGGTLWVEAMPEAEPDEDRPARAGDGVSSVMITSNDLAGAWAIGERGQALYPTVPNDPRQREMAFRSGINIVMYSLTGNYKADQVHVPDLLQRLGQ